MARVARIAAVAQTVARNAAVALIRVPQRRYLSHFASRRATAAIFATGERPSVPPVRLPSLGNRRRAAVSYFWDSVAEPVLPVSPVDEEVPPVVDEPLPEPVSELVPLPALP